MREVEQREGRPIADVLRDLYALHGTQSAVADALGIDQSTLSLWLLRLGLEQRTVLVRREVER
jgi:hypothetical protein